MAIIYRATLRPSKLELIAGWLPQQPWYDARVDEAPVALGAYRFDDPAGEVGIETHLLRVGDGPVLQVPLTYRAAALADAEPALLGTMDHSVLGERWVYDGCGDPVYASALAHALFGGGRQADENIVDSGEVRDPSVVVQGSGLPAEPIAYSEVEYTNDGDRTRCTLTDTEFELLRLIDPAVPASGDHVLTGTWDAQREPVLLARGLGHSRLA